MAGIATVGVEETACLIMVKLTLKTVACPTSDSDVVHICLYATELDLHLILFGFLGYLCTIAFAVAPLFFNSPELNEFRLTLEDWTEGLLIVSGILMMVESGYLMYLQAFEIKTVCFYCVVNALLSASLFALAVIRQWEFIGQPMLIGIFGGMLVLITTLGVYTTVNNPRTDTQGGYMLMRDSGASEISLAQPLKQVKAKMYGSFTCTHYQHQKQLFGQEAANQLLEIECNPVGKSAQPDFCEAANIQDFPTWEINGKFYQGEKTLQELADLSGYQGNRNFQNSPSPGHYPKVLLR